MTAPTATSLDDWLLEQIAADEALLAAPTSRRMIRGEMVDVVIDRLPAYVERDRARWRRECEAKRAIVEYHPLGTGSYEGHECDGLWASDRPCRTLIALASVYLGADGWQEAWNE